MSTLPTNVRTEEDFNAWMLKIWDSGGTIPKTLSIFPGQLEALGVSKTTEIIKIIDIKQNEQTTYIEAEQ